jgi:TrmH family RNA methyltransferase
VPSHRPVLDWAGSLPARDVDVSVVGADERGDLDVADVDFTRATLLVIGNETAGLSAAWRDACDHLARIPMLGAASSLNAAMAASIVLYESARQRIAASARAG